MRFHFEIRPAYLPLIIFISPPVTGLFQQPEILYLYYCHVFSLWTPRLSFSAGLCFPHPDKFSLCSWLRRFHKISLIFQGIYLTCFLFSLSWASQPARSRRSVAFRRTIYVAPDGAPDTTIRSYWPRNRDADSKSEGIRCK